MSGFARIDNVPGTVTEVVPTLSVDDSDGWYPFAGSVQVGWHFDGEHFTLPPMEQPEQPEYQLTIVDKAQTALAESDVTIIRCIEHGLPVPSSWITYRATLRDVVAGRADILPNRPAFPAGS